MSKHWLSFWNQDTRRAQQQPRSGGNRSGAELWIPHGRGLVKQGHRVFCVGVADGEMRFYASVEVGQTRPDPDHNDSVDVWSAAGTAKWADPDIIVPREVVARLLYAHTDGTTHRIALTRNGAVSGNSFQGKASLRELIDGWAELDSLL